MTPKANQRGGNGATHPNDEPAAASSDRRVRWQRRVNTFEIVIGELPPENITDPKIVRLRSSNFLKLIDHPEESLELTSGQVTGLTEFYYAAMREGEFGDPDDLSEEAREKHKHWMSSEDERLVDKAAMKMAKDRENEPAYDDWIKAQKLIRTLEGLIKKNRANATSELAACQEETEQLRRDFEDCQQKLSECERKLQQSLAVSKGSSNKGDHLIARSFTQVKQTNKADAALIAHLKAQNEHLQNRVEDLEALSRLTVRQHSEAVPEKPPAKKSPAEKSPAEKSPAEKSPAEKSPAEKSPAEKSPAEKSPAEKSPADKKRKRSQED